MDRVLGRVRVLPEADLMDVKDIVRLMTEAGCTDSQIMYVTGLTLNGLLAIRR